MYAETTTTGINLMDLNRQQAMLIRDSLALARSRGELLTGERLALNEIIATLHHECENLAPEQFRSGNESDLG